MLQTFVHQDFMDFLLPDLDLGDLRRTKRFGIVFQTMACQPGASLPQLFPDPTDYHNCLHLLHSEACSHAEVLGSHQETVLNRLDQLPQTVLLLHDGTLFDFSGHTTLEDDLGSIGNGGGRGWIVHHTLAVDPNNRLVYGLVSQILHVRETLPEKETIAEKRERKSRESLLWQRGLDEIGPTPPTCHRVDVADRGADIFEFLQQLQDRKRRFVIRSKHNRAMGSSASDQRAPELLHDRLRTLPAQGCWPYRVAGKKGKSEREAMLSVAAEEVLLRCPHVKKGKYRPESIAVTAIRVWEANPPVGEEPLEWILLTNEPMLELADLQRAVGWYACRMQIEEFHKVQKSGMGVEKGQLQTVSAMATLVAMRSVLSVALMNLRLAARDPVWCDEPAERMVPRMWIEVLNILNGGKKRKKRPAKTVREFWVALARLGGYLKNPLQHPPGWITIWRGWCILHHLIHYEMSRPKMS